MVEQECIIKAEITFIVLVPKGKPHKDYAKYAVEQYANNADIYLDGRDEDPVRLFVDNLDIGEVEN